MSNPTGPNALSSAPLHHQFQPKAVDQGVVTERVQELTLGAPTQVPWGSVRTRTMQTPSQQQQGDMALYFSSDDRVLSKHVEDTHVADGDSRIGEVRPLFNLVQDLLAQTAQTIQDFMPGTHHNSRKELVAGRNIQCNQQGLPNVGLIIEHVSYELATRQGSGSDAHETTMGVLKLLGHLSWEAKAVVTLAAFAMSYGEFWLLAQILTSNQLANSMAALKQLPLLLEHTASYKNVFDAIDELTQAMLLVSDCILHFNEIPPLYIMEDDSAVKAARTHLPIAVYWTIRSAVTAATQITSLTCNIGYEHTASAMDVYELQNRTHKLKAIYQHFMTILNKLKERIDEKRENEAYEMLVKAIYNIIHVDNMPVLSHIVIQHDQLPALHDGSNRGRVYLDVLRRKNILLLISDLNISLDELSVLEQIYNDSKIHAYEILWLPINVERSYVEWTDGMQVQFERLRGTMLWYTVHHPSNISNAFIKFARKHWNFRSTPVLVVLDPRGRVLSPNAMHMMWIWGSSAFPFTTEREEMLWRDETWRLELLVDGIDQTVLDWAREGKYIFIYGGDDVELTRRFTREARAIAQAAGISLEMMYVGKSNKREVVRKMCAAIVSEGMSSCWEDPPMVWFFWKRIESMLFSKMELKKADDHSDIITQEIKKLLSYDKIPGGWALLSKGSEIVLHGQMSAVVTALTRYERESPHWKNEIPRRSFSEVFKQEVTIIHINDLPCCKFEFPAVADPVGFLCPECNKAMEKHSTFICCHEGGLAHPTPITAPNVSTITQT